MDGRTAQTCQEHHQTNTFKRISFGLVLILNSIMVLCSSPTVEGFSNTHSISLSSSHRKMGCQRATSTKRNYQDNATIDGGPSVVVTEHEEDDFADLDITLIAHIPKISKIDSLDQLDRYLAQDRKRLTIIKFYAPWCKSCAKFAMRFKKLAMKNGDLFDSKDNMLKKGEVRFAEIEYSPKNDPMFRTLNVMGYPYVHVYRGAERLSEFPCGPSNFQLVIKTMNKFLGRPMETESEVQIEHKIAM
mmetsp:Transcript_57555/g.67189  ORF Transcript_57555/g.67189 Transcript_57555/m.67189 type:complete len:245 (-) Transcript_57555:204-938(-)|eukprot:CAMPEP_0194374476 /NCGR_PEP_ID=MMETSP0174-20130528/22894_1 /TAXON_ID=216777 /ORGANISM="Proboscia alata, Strain PI-D3" /LENGTH=244 /DNA_ID=CAMNT_0039154065 /DNA_START=81 /DNA_END=815 /DNA_ORIENTATION=+